MCRGDSHVMRRGRARTANTCTSCRLSPSVPGSPWTVLLTRILLYRPTRRSLGEGLCMAVEGGVYHLFFTEWLNHCPMTFNTFYTSTHIAHATAPTPLRPWTRAGVAVPPAAGNPALSQAPLTWLLYFTNHRWLGPQRQGLCGAGAHLQLQAMSTPCACV